MRVLIVEDEPLLALQLEDALLANAHTVVGFAFTSREAVTLAKQTRPDLLLLDLYLDDGPTGTRVAHQLAASFHTVFITGSSEELPDDLAGAVGIIKKPYTGRGLTDALKWLGLATSGGVPPPPPPSLKLAPGFMPNARGLYELV